MEIINESFFQKQFPERKPDAHKGDFGRVLIFAGSPGMAGAAVLAGKAAARSGAGLVRFLIPSFSDPVYPILQTAVPVATCIVPEMIPDLNAYDAVAAGSGLGNSAERMELLQWIADTYRGRLVLDADALNAMSSGKIRFGRNGEASAQTVLTPHIGEARRLLGEDLPVKTETEREEAVQTIAKKYGSCVLLKGAGTLVCSPDLRIIKNMTGNPGMAAGGSGDVLSGIIAAFAGQGLPVFEAAACGAFIHGFAGDLAAAELGQVCMNAEDLITFLPKAWKQLHREL